MRHPCGCSPQSDPSPESGSRRKGVRGRGSPLKELFLPQHVQAPIQQPCMEAESAVSWAGTKCQAPPLCSASFPSHSLPLCGVVRLFSLYERGHRTGEVKYVFVVIKVVRVRTQIPDRLLLAKPKFLPVWPPDSMETEEREPVRLELGVVMESIFHRAGPFCLGRKEECVHDYGSYPSMAPGKKSRSPRKTGARDKLPVPLGG